MAWGQEACETLRSIGSGAMELAPFLLTLANGTRRRGTLRGSDVRREILRILEERSAVPLAELRERIPVASGTLWHHVKTLVEAGAVRVIAGGKRKIVVRANTSPSEVEIRALAALGGATARKIAVHICDHANLSVAEVSKTLGLSQRIVYYHVKCLIDAQLLTSARGARQAALQPTPLLHAMLASSVGRG